MPDTYPLLAGSGGDDPTPQDRNGADGHEIDLQQDISAKAIVGLGRDASDDESRPLGERLDDEDEGFEPLSVEFKHSRYNEASVLTVESTAETWPDTNRQLAVQINDTFVGAGRIEESAPKTSTGGGAGSSSAATVVKAFDEIRYLKQSTFTATFVTTPVSDIVETVFATAGVAGSVDLDFDPLLTTTYENEGCAAVLDRLSTMVRGAWYTDFRETDANQLLFTDDPAIQRHNIGGILETDAGLQTAPYDGVVVIGGQPSPSDPSGSESGSDPAAARNVVAHEPIRATAGETGTGARVFRHTDKSIQGQETATSVAHSLLDEFERQQGSGSITLVGNASIRPLDTMTMPPGLGGQEYIVSSVTQTCSVKDGFKTEIGVGGVIDPERGPGTPIGPSGGGGGGSGDSTEPVTLN